MKPAPASALPGMRFYWALALCLGAGLLSYVFVLHATMLWDFKTCYAAGWLVRHGQSPYDNHALFAVSQPCYWSLLMVFVCWCLFSKHILVDLRQAWSREYAVPRVGKRSKSQERRRYHQSAPISP
jgi:hypothetical protein